MSTAEDEEEAEEEEETGKKQKKQVVRASPFHDSIPLIKQYKHCRWPFPTTTAETDFRTTGCRSEATKSQIKVKVA